MARAANDVTAGKKEEEEEYIEALRGTVYKQADGSRRHAERARTHIATGWRCLSRVHSIDATTDDTCVCVYIRVHQQRARASSASRFVSTRRAIVHATATFFVRRPSLRHALKLRAGTEELDRPSLGYISRGRLIFFFFFTTAISQQRAVCISLSIQTALRRE